MSIKYTHHLVCSLITLENQTETWSVRHWDKFNDAELLVSRRFQDTAYAPSSSSLFGMMSCVPGCSPHVPAENASVGMIDWFSQFARGLRSSMTIYHKWKCEGLTTSSTGSGDCAQRNLIPQLEARAFLLGQSGCVHLAYFDLFCFVWAL